MGSLYAKALKWVCASYFAILCLPVSAADSFFDLTLKGKVIADTCEVENVQVDLGKHFAHKLDTELNTREQSFEVKISQCPPENLNRRAIRVRFDGTADARLPTRFHNEGSAANVAIRMFEKKPDGTGNTIAPRSILLVFLSRTGTGKKTLYAQIEKAGQANVQPGTVSATVPMVLIYQ